MIISRTPFRISFFGGGTDYPEWCNENSGAVLATTINKYCYITCRYLPPFFKHKSRIIYSRIEEVRRVSEIRHPAVRACLKYMKITKGVEIHHDSDLPARAGLGSSSSFAVGLLHALYALKGKMPTKRRLALDACHIEQVALKENVGCQDQVLAAFGGFNLIEFGGQNPILVHPVTISPERLVLLQDHMMLFFTGFSRIASEIAAEQIKNIPYRKKELRAIRRMVDEALYILNSGANLTEFGRLLHDHWRIKKCLSAGVSTPAIDEIYSTAMRAGASGGKLLGAGGGGFMIIFAKPDAHDRIREKLKKLLFIHFRFENLGSQVIFYSPYDHVSHV